MCLHNIKILLFSYLFVLTLLSCLSISLTSVARGVLYGFVKWEYVLCFQGLSWHKDESTMVAMQAALAVSGVGYSGHREFLPRGLITQSWVVLEKSHK